MAHLNSQLVQWLESCSRQDRLAFGELYQATASHLFALALRILNRKDWAEEALQDSYLKIWNKSGDFDSERGKAFTWMATIVRNRCLDQLRKAGREPLTQEELKEELRPAQGPDTLEQLEGLEKGRALQRCLQELSQEERESLLLAYWKGMTHTELSLHLDRPLGTVKTWVRRGLEKLKGCLTR